MDFALLKAVSRSFYLSMVWLPPTMRRGIALGYMLARATDSVADTSCASAEKRAEVLRQMGLAIAGENYSADLLPMLRSEMADAQSKESEAMLLRRFDECLELLHRASEEERRLIRRVLSTIIEGQLWDLTYFACCGSVQSDAETRQYTYMVAAAWVSSGRIWDLPPWAGDSAAPNGAISWQKPENGTGRGFSWSISCAIWMKMPPVGAAISALTRFCGCSVPGGI